ncbi:hypothetical protein ACOAMY_17305 [Pseudomonas aeruginosa]
MKRDLLASVSANASPLEKTAAQVLREALDRIPVHPCDEGDDAVAAKQLAPEMQALLQALTGVDKPAPDDDLLAEAAAVADDLWARVSRTGQLGYPAGETSNALNSAARMIDRLVAKVKSTGSENDHDQQANIRY